MPFADHHELSSAEELHPHALPEPYVSLSTHTALINQPMASPPGAASVRTMSVDVVRSPVLRQNSVRREVVDLPALIWRRSWFNDHPPAPAASPPALSLRRPPPARPRKPRLAPATRRLQANGAPAEATHD